MGEIRSVMALLHPSHQPQDVIRSEGFEGQHHCQEPPDLRDRKRWCFFFQPELEMPKKEMGQHTREHVMVPAGVRADFIVGHAEFGFRFLKALFNGPPYATEPYEQA